MNKQQKLVLVGLIAVIIGMLLFPPFHIIGPNGFVSNMGYGWIFNPPKPGYLSATVNISMLLLQWLAAVLVAVLAFFLVSESKSAVAPAVAPETGDVTTSKSHALFSILFLSIRVVRGIAGLTAGYQIVGILPVITWLQDIDGVSGNMVAKLFIKVFILAIALLIFFGLRRVLNAIYVRKFNIPHPSLAATWRL